jgi:hypothetical protein
MLVADIYVYVHVYIIEMRVYTEHAAMYHTTIYYCKNY